MPKLAIIDHVVSAAGVERFLHGLVGGLLELPEIKEWDITILLNRYNSGGYMVRWPAHLTAPNVHVRYLCDDGLSRFLNRLAKAQRIWGIPGTARIQRIIPWLLRRYGPLWLRRHAGDARLWIEHYCTQQRFDVVYFSYPYLMESPRVSMPMVATQHDFNYKRFNTLGPVTRAQIDSQMPEWLRRCRHLVVSSEFIASELRYFYPEFADKVRVLRLGIPGDSRIPSEVELEAYRQRMGLPQQFLLTVGWIVPHKNQKVLFEALGNLRSKGINISLVCVGPNSDQLQPGNKDRAGSYVREVLRVAEHFGLQYGHDFWGLGYVDDFELECLYRGATALVVPVLYEAGSFPVLEAMRALCPVVCSRIPALVEQARLVEDNIWLFDPSDSYDLANVIQGILNDPTVATERGRCAKQMVDKIYSWGKTAEGYLAVFQEAIGGID